MNSFGKFSTNRPDSLALQLLARLDDDGWKEGELALRSALYFKMWSSCNAYEAPTPWIESMCLALALEFHQTGWRPSRLPFRAAYEDQSAFAQAVRCSYFGDLIVAEGLSQDRGFVEALREAEKLRAFQIYESASVTTSDGSPRLRRDGTQARFKVPAYQVGGTAKRFMSGRGVEYRPGILIPESGLSAVCIGHDRFDGDADWTIFDNESQTLLLGQQAHQQALKAYHTQINR